MQVRHVTRRMGWVPRPLRRDSDRREFRLTLLLLLAVLLLAPGAATLAAGAASREVARSNVEERARHHRAPAVLRDVVAVGAAGSAAATAEWTAPGGAVRTGTVYVAAGRRSGDTVHVWVDDWGRLTGPPGQRSPGFGAGLGAAAAVCAVVAGLAAVRRLAGRRIERRRLREWQEEWAVVGPRWSRER